MRSPGKRAAKRERRRIAAEARAREAARWGSTLPEMVSNIGASLRAEGEHAKADALDIMALNAGVVPADIAKEMERRRIIEVQPGGLVPTADDLADEVRRAGGDPSAATRDQIAEAINAIDQRRAVRYVVPV